MKKRSKKEFKESLLEINRHIIGSIDLSDMFDIDSLTPSDRLKYLQDSELIYNNNTFQNELKWIVQRQLEFIGMESVEFDHTLVGRGTMNCADLLTERFEKLHEEYKAVTRPEKKAKNPFNPLPETDE